MARIRTIKPEFFRHEVLQDLEISNPGKYPMMVFEGLWAIADREGRFEWRPRRIKLDVLPFLPFEMADTLAILENAGFIQRYEHDGDEYGVICSWDRHQIVSRDEPPSEIPAPDGTKTPYFKPLNQTQRFKVYERDKWTCAYCSREMRNDKRSACLDHVIPYSKGGTNREQNLVTCCKKCNAEKSDKTPIEAGFKWPAGLGEYLDKVTNTIRQYGINPPLTGGATPPDKEGEWEGEKEREVEREGGKKVARSEFPLTSRENLIDDAVASSPSDSDDVTTTFKHACQATWGAYSDSYHDRYGVLPVRNAKTNAQIVQFVKRLGAEESPPVAAFFVGHSSAFYVRKSHDLGSLLADAEKLRMEWATGRMVTTTGAQQSDRTQSNFNAANDALRILEQKGVTV